MTNILRPAFLMGSISHGGYLESLDLHTETASPIGTDENEKEKKEFRNKSVPYSCHPRPSYDSSHLPTLDNYYGPTSLRALRRVFSIGVLKSLRPIGRAPSASPRPGQARRGGLASPRLAWAIGNTASNGQRYGSAQMREVLRYYTVSGDQVFNRF